MWRTIPIRAMQVGCLLTHANDLGSTPYCKIYNFFDSALQPLSTHTHTHTHVMSFNNVAINIQNGVRC